MAEFFAELKRRQMFRVAAAYAVVAWLLLQLINNLTPALRLPEWAATLVVVLLIAGFPVALLFNWIQHLPADGATQSAKTGRREWLLIGGLGLVILLIAYQQMAPSFRQGGVEAGAISLAVLPFDNLSGDASQEFFSDGMTEELTSALARIPDLRVVARTSAYQFRSQNRDIQTIGQQLNATHFIEGSVRKAGERVRITAQLIKANDGTHVWTETYDRQLTDIFAIQEEIGRSIVSALRMPLGLQPGQTLFPSRDIDSQSYEQYLAVKAARRSGGQNAAARVAAVESLEQVVARHPRFAPAWAALAQAYFRRAIGLPGNPTVAEVRRSMDEWRPKAQAAARRAIELDPSLPDGYSQLGITFLDKDLLQGEELFSKALALDPLHPDTMHPYAYLLGYTGRVKEAIAMRARLTRIEPLVGLYAGNYEEMLWVDGQEDALNARLRERPPSPGFRATFFARMYAAQGRYADAADSVKTDPRGGHPEGAVEAAERLLRALPVSSAGGSAQNLPRLGSDLDFVYVHVGAPELVMQAYEDALAGGAANFGHFALLWHPSYAPVRKTERFKAYVRSARLVDYWRAKGWPSFCRLTAGDDFECE